MSDRSLAARFSCYCCVVNDAVVVFHMFPSQDTEQAFERACELTTNLLAAGPIDRRGPCS